MIGHLGFRRGYQHASGHSQVDDPLVARSLTLGEIKDDMLPDAANLVDTRAFQHSRDGGGR